MATWPHQDDATNVGVPGTSGNYGSGTAQQVANTFVPKIWSDEVLIQREVNLVAASFFKRINHKGKKGDTIVIPFISDLTANKKVATEPVTIQNAPEGLISVLLNTHYEVSKLYEDFFMLQQRYDLRSEYNKKAGYALAKALDSDIFSSMVTETTPGASDAGTLSYTYKVVGSDGKTQWLRTGSGNGSDITDAGLRRVIQTLDDNLAPNEDRALFIPPSQKNALLGIDKFTLFQDIGRTKELTTGQFGEIYGLKVFVTTNLPSVAAADATAYKIAFVAHKDAVCSAIQMDVRTQAQYKQEYLATLVTSDMVYGVKPLRIADSDVSTSNYRKSQAVAIYVPA